VSGVAASINEIETMASRTADATGGLRHSAVELAGQTATIRERIMRFADSVRAAQA
jgi:hypothetical protein